MSKFKVGDRVVRVNYDNGGKFVVGDAAVIIDDSNPNLLIVRVDRTGIESDSYPQNLELEDVYNSPLYQALL